MKKAPLPKCEAIVRVDRHPLFCEIPCHEPWGEWFLCPAHALLKDMGQTLELLVGGRYMLL